ncbi:MAG: membrane protein insertase YidC, partial [Bosea sp. (in: a-proteobacteria)]
MMKEDNRNLLLAITLSVVVLLGWQYFYGVPQAEKQKQTAQQNQQVQTAPAPGVPAPGQTAATAPGMAAPAALTAETRDQALARSARVRIETPKVTGSISLTGARIDDVSLKAYRETVDANSPNIVLLSPLGGPNPYYSD